jgi:hypothetical protein
MARKAYKMNRDDINEDLELCRGAINNSDAVNSLDEVTNLRDFLRLLK